MARSLPGRQVGGLRVRRVRQLEVYVTSFPGAAGNGSLARRGGEPRWRADGKEIFYMASSGMLMAVPVSNRTVSRLERLSPVPNSRPRADFQHGCF